VQAIAAGLHTLGVGRGDTVALMLLNRPEFNLVDTAAVHLGAIPFSIYNTSSPGQIAYVFENAQNRVVVTEQRFLPHVLAARTPELEHVVLVDGAAPGTRTLDELAQRRAGFGGERDHRRDARLDLLGQVHVPAQGHRAPVRRDGRRREPRLELNFSLARLQKAMGTTLESKNIDLADSPGGSDSSQAVKQGGGGRGSRF